MKFLTVKKIGCGVGFILSIVTISSSAIAEGMVPETSVVIINEADGEGSINIKNTDNKPALLHVNIENVPEDDEPLLLTTSPVSRVEANDTQLVRFILQNKKPLTTERLKRVIFEGIPPQNKADGNVKIVFSVAQNLPVIIRPKGLPLNQEPWKLLTWTAYNGKLTLSNKSAYVVRLSDKATALPTEQNIKLPRTYLLPGEEKIVADPFDSSQVSTIRIYPATTYGFQVESYDAPLSK